MFTMSTKVTPLYNSKGESHGHNQKRWAHILISLMVGPYYKSFKCRPYLMVFKGGHHVVISKGDRLMSTITEKVPHFIILKGGSYGHNHDRRSQMVAMKVALHCEPYKCAPIFGFL